MTTNEPNKRVELYDDVLKNVGQMVDAMTAMTHAFDRINDSLKKLWEDEKRKNETN